MKGLGALMVVGLASLACGASAVSGPSTPTLSAQPITITDGITGQAVAATVENVGSRVRVTARGYLTREQATAPTISLWSAPDPSYIRALVYLADAGVEPARRWTIEHPLERWDGGPFRHCIGVGIDEAVVASAAVAASAATGIPQSSGGPCNIEWIVDPDVRGAQTERRFSGRSIVGARLIFNDARLVSSTALHELGHVLGLGHSPRNDDVMAPTDDGRRRRDFSADEVAVLAMMYHHRQPGNAWPDLAP